MTANTAEVSPREDAPINGEPVRPWEQLVTLGKQAARFQWELGDLASEVQTVYGQNNLGKYAKEIGVELKSLQEYRRVALAYPPESRHLATLWVGDFDS